MYPKMSGYLHTGTILEASGVLVTFNKQEGHFSLHCHQSCQAHKSNRSSYPLASRCIYIFLGVQCLPRLVSPSTTSVAGAECSTSNPLGGFRISSQQSMEVNFTPETAKQGFCMHLLPAWSETPISKMVDQLGQWPCSWGDQVLASIHTRRCVRRTDFPLVALVQIAVESIPI